MNKNVDLTWKRRGKNGGPQKRKQQKVTKENMTSRNRLRATMMIMKMTQNVCYVVKNILKTMKVKSGSDAVFV